MGADTAGRTNAFTAGNRMGHPSVGGGIEPKKVVDLRSLSQKENILLAKNTTDSELW
jgi:hypothetical protein